MFVTYLKVRGHVKGTTRCGITTVKENNVDNLFMAGALVIIINSKLTKSVNNFASFEMTAVNFINLSLIIGNISLKLLAIHAIIIHTNYNYFRSM